MTLIFVRTSPTLWALFCANVRRISTQNVRRSFSIRSTADRLRRSSNVLLTQSIRCVFCPPLSCLINHLHVLDSCVGQVRRTCPCGRHHYRARLNTEPAIVSVMAPIDAGPMSNERTHAFTNVQAYQPASNTSAASFSPAAPLLRPRIYITDYFGKKKDR